MKYFSTFSGIGGFERAIELVHPEWECVGYSEIDKYAIQAYQSHYPTHKNYGDITKIDIAALPDFDLLVGGSPCQDLSIAKKNREGLQGERSKLFFKYLEILKIKKPKYFILENVNSMTKENKQLITDYIKEIYPDVQMTMINAALVSAQSRKRCFWTNFSVTQPEDRKIFLKDILEPVVDEKYFLKKDNKITPKLINDNNIKVAGTLDEGTWSKRYEEIRRVYDINGQAPTLPTGTGGGVIPKIVAVEVSHQGTIIGKVLDKSITLMARDYKGFGNQLTNGVISGCALRTYPRNPTGEERSKNVESRDDGKANCLTSVESDSMVNCFDIYNNNLKKDGKAKVLGTNPQCSSAVAGQAVIIKHGTITEAMGRSGSSKEFIASVNNINNSGFGIRKLTPVECARLQCFPDDWCSMLSNTQQYKCYGNAVNVDVVAHIIKQIKEGENNEILRNSND